MEELSEKLKLICELKAYTSVYEQYSEEPSIPYWSETGKSINAKQKKACIAYMEQFIKEHQDVTFKEFVKDWAKRASIHWDNGADFTYYVLYGFNIKFDVHHYMAKLLIDEIKKNFSKEIVDKIYQLYVYSDDEYTLIKTKELAPEQSKIYEKATVGIAKEDWQALYDEYIRYLVGAVYLVNEEIRKEHIEELVFSTQLTFIPRLKEKAKKELVNKVYEDVTSAKHIKQYVLEKYNYLVKKMRYQAGGMETLTRFRDRILRPERELAERAKILAENLFALYCKDEFIASDKTLIEFNRERMFNRIWDKIRVLEPEKEWNQKIEFEKIEDVPYGNRTFTLDMNLDNTEGTIVNNPKMPEVEEKKEDESAKAKIIDGYMYVGDRKIKLSDKTLELLGRKPNVEEEKKSQETTYQKLKIQDIDIPEEAVRNEVKEIIDGIRRRDENYVKFDKANADVIICFIEFDNFNEYECYLIIKELMNQGVGINDIGASGSTPLHAAVVNYRNYILKFLIKNSANVNTRDDSGNTPLHDAAFAMNKDAIDMLLDNGADINAQDPNGFTPLITAYMRLYAEKQKPLRERSKEIEAASAFIMEYLIKKGSDLTLKIEQFDNMPIALMLKSLMDGFEE